MENSFCIIFLSNVKHFEYYSELWKDLIRDFWNSCFTTEVNSCHTIVSHWCNFGFSVRWDTKGVAHIFWFWKNWVEKMETSVFLSAIFIFSHQFFHLLCLLGLCFAFPTIDYYCYSIIYSGDSEAQTQQTQKCKIWRKKMKKALRKTPVSIFSTQFFQF